MTPYAKRQKFEHYRKSLEVAGLSTTRDDSLVCPLCWLETSYDELSGDHIVPESIGGQIEVLTCTRCNNEHGSKLDSHLSQYQTVADAFKGHGTFKTELRANGNRVAANLKWNVDRKDFFVVGKASNPVEVAQFQAEMKAQSVREINMTLSFGYSKNNFQTAVLRAAYLVLFKVLGYEYARHEIVQVIRRRVADSSLGHPRLGSLIAELRDFTPPYDFQHYVISGNVNDTKLFFVIIRVRKVTTSYLGAYLPIPCEHVDQFFELMEQHSKDHDGERITIPIDGMVS